MAMTISTGPTSVCARNLPQHFNGCTCTAMPGQMTGEATEVTLTTSDPLTQARYTLVEEATEELVHSAAEPLEEGFGDEDAPDASLLHDDLWDAWDDFDSADGTIAAMRAYADRIEAAEKHVWAITSDAPGGGYDEMNGRRAAAREDYWDEKATESIAALKTVASRLRALANRHEDAAFTGSGWGDHRPTETVTDIDQVRVGDLLAEQSEQFGARNLFLVTSIERNRGVAHGFFTDPVNPGEKRLASDMDQVRWDFQVANGEMSFTDVRGPAFQPITPTHQPT